MNIGTIIIYIVDDSNKVYMYRPVPNLIVPEQIELKKVNEFIPPWKRRPKHPENIKPRR